MLIFNFTNKYLRSYLSLCDRTTLDLGYTETHHIYPKSIFGNNKEVVILSPKEHFIAHLLLYKAYKKEYGKHDKLTSKMFWAIVCMSKMRNEYTSERYKIPSRLYENLRKNLPPISEEKRAKHIKHNREFWSKKENRQQQSETRKEYYRTNPDAKIEVGVFFKEFYDTPEWKEKLADPERLKKSFRSDEANLKRVLAMKNGGTQKARDSYMNKTTFEERSNKGKIGYQVRLEQNPTWAKEQGEKIKGRIYVVNLESFEKRTVDKDNIPEGFVLWATLTKEQKALFPKKEWDAGKASRGTKFIYNKELGIVKKLKDGEELPYGYCFGRVIK